MLFALAAIHDIGFCHLFDKGPDMYHKQTTEVAVLDLQTLTIAQRVEERAGQINRSAGPNSVPESVIIGRQGCVDQS